jgi:hypothetical protein
MLQKFSNENIGLWSNNIFLYQGSAGFLRGKLVLAIGLRPPPPASYPSSIVGLRIQGGRAGQLLSI